jgi:hypothetical protein
LKHYEPENLGNPGIWIQVPVFKNLKLGYIQSHITDTKLPLREDSPYFPDNIELPLTDIHGGQQQNKHAYAEFNFLESILRGDIFHGSNPSPNFTEEHGKLEPDVHPLTFFGLTGETHLKGIKFNAGIGYGKNGEWMDDTLSWEISAKKDFEFWNGTLTPRIVYIGEKILSSGSAPYQELDIGSLRADSLGVGLNYQEEKWGFEGKAFVKKEGVHPNAGVSYKFNLGDVKAKAFVSLDYPFGEPYEDYNAPRRGVFGLTISTDILKRN